MGVIGDIAGMFGGSGDSDEARRILESLKAEAGPSALSTYTEDPALRTQQMSTMGALRDIGNTQGMRLPDRVAMREAVDESNRNEQGQRGAIMQGYEARGLGGSGASLAAQLVSAQGGANRTAQAGARYAADANERALRAVTGAGTMAGQVRGQDYGVASGKASATDAMARFNAGQRVTKAGMQSGWLTGESDKAKGRWQNLGNDVENSAAAAYGKWGG